MEGSSDCSYTQWVTRNSIKSTALETEQLRCKQKAYRHITNCRTEIRAQILTGWDQLRDVFCVHNTLCLT